MSIPAWKPYQINQGQNCPKKYWPLLMFNSVFMACLGMIVMRFVA